MDALLEILGCFAIICVLIGMYKIIKDSAMGKIISLSKSLRERDELIDRLSSHIVALEEPNNISLEKFHCKNSTVEDEETRKYQEGNIIHNLEYIDAAVEEAHKDRDEAFNTAFGIVFREAFGNSTGLWDGRFSRVQATMLVDMTLKKMEESKCKN